MSSNYHPELLLWNASTVSAALMVTEDTVRNLHRTAQLVGVKCGKHLRWTPRAVRQFVERLGRQEWGAGAMSEFLPPRFGRPLHPLADPEDVNLAVRMKAAFRRILNAGDDSTEQRWAALAARLVRR